MKNQLHEKGFKGVRDREQVVRKYDELVTTLHLPRVKDEVLARMSNNELYRLCEDTYNRLPDKKKVYYAQSLGKLRENDTSFRWWWKDMVRICRPNALGYVVLVFKSIVLYPAYVKKKKAKIAQDKASAEEAKKALSDAAKAKPRDPDSLTRAPTSCISCSKFGNCPIQYVGNDCREWAPKLEVIKK